MTPTYSPLDIETKRANQACRHIDITACEFADEFERSGSDSELEGLYLQLFFDHCTTTINDIED